MDALDQNKAKNKAGQLIGKLKPVDNSPKEDALQARAPPAARRADPRADPRDAARNSATAGATVS